MKTFFTTIFLLVALNSIAQIKLAGTVSSSGAVGFANISVDNSATNFKRNTQTDTAGNYTFNNLAAGTYQLSITYVGYEKYTSTIKLLRDTIINIQLKFNNKQLNDVTIVGAKQVVTKSADKMVFNIASSVTAGGTDALDAISKIPGVKVNGTDISVVGKGMVNVMIDGRLVQLSGEALLRYIRSISSNQLSKIELITNPSARYETDGNAGIINIVTKQNKKEGYTGNIQFSGKYTMPDKLPIYNLNTFGEAAINGTASYNKGRWSANAGFNFVRGRLLEGFGVDVYYPTQSWLQTDTGVFANRNIEYNATVNYKLSNSTTIGIGYMGGRNVYEGSDHVNNPVYNQAGGIDSTLKTYATYYPIAYTNAVNLNSITKLDTSGKTLTLNADYFNYYRTDLSDFESNTYNASDAVVPQSRTRYFDTNKQNINVYTFKADADIPTRFAKFAFGGKLSFIKNYSNAFYYDKDGQGNLSYNTNLSNEFDYTENTQSVYAMGDKQMGKWQVQAGLRTEFTQTKGYSYNLNQTTPNNYIRLFPSMLVNYKANDDNVFAFTLGRRINRPTFWNLNPFKSLMTTYSYLEGNPYLQPEYNTNMELSHTYKGIFTTSVFFNVTNNGYGSVTIAEADTNFVHTIPLNFLKAYRYGITESIALNPAKWWESNQQLNLYHTSANSALTYVNSIKGWGAYIASNNTFYLKADKTLAAAVNFWCQFPEIEKAGRSNTYYKLDLGIRGSVLNKKLDLTLLLNDAIRRSAPSVLSTVNGLPTRYTSFQVNRYLQLTASYRFGNTGAKAVKNQTGNADEKGRL